MNLLWNQLISTIMQLWIFIALPFIWWKWFKPPVHFSAWIGIKPVNHVTKKLVTTSLITFVVFALFGTALICVTPDSTVLANTKFNNFKLTTVLAMLLYAFFQTATAEEILFRGFFAKRIQHKFGYFKGNLTQAILFGALHCGLLLASHIGLIFVLLTFIFTSCIGFAFYYIDEKMANGSIIPSILLHGCANAVSSLVFMSGLII